MRAIILTYAPVQESDKEILKNTKIFKLALNNHAEEYKPDLRICSDYILSDICRDFPQKVVSVREKFRFTTDRVEYFPNFQGATISSGIEYLIFKGYDEILIIGNNKVNTKEFQERVNKHIEQVKEYASIYQYTNGNFNLPVKSITEFCSL
jgi:hypothetical protein